MGEEFLEPTPAEAEAAVWAEMPKAVSEALSKVMAGVTKLGKDERNPFANYKYAGIESFLEMLRPLCAEAGLNILMDEESVEFRDAADKGGKMVTWLVMRFAFGLAAGGETWPQKIRRTAMVQASMGSQAFGAAQSYALKSFLRSQALIATGESEDADSHEQRDLPKKTKAQSRPDFTELEAGIRACETKAELQQWGVNNRLAIESLPDGWQRNLRAEYTRHLESLAS